MVKSQPSIALAPPAPRLLANDLPTDRDALEAQKDILWDFTDSGIQVWKQPPDESSELTSKIQQLWIERGDFSQLTIESIQNQKSASATNTKDPSTTAGVTASDEPSHGDQINPPESITTEDLWELRMKMAHQLGVMAGELSTGLDFLNILLAPLAPEAVDTTVLPLPAGGIAPRAHSHDHPSSQPETIILLDSSISLMRKRQAAKNASSLLKRVSGELNREAKRSQNQWGMLLELREAGWHLRPKGAKPGVDMSLAGRGAERAAKEIGIAYATTEAAEALRASSFACFEPLDVVTNDPTQFSLKLPPRPRRRLSINLILPNEAPEHFSPWDQYDRLDINSLPFGENLELARAEVLEEEIFGQISKEAQSSTTYRTSTSDSAVIIKGFGENAEIRFEMIEAEDETRTTSKVSDKGKLISALIRLSMVSIYRSRRRGALGVITSTTQCIDPKILEPVLDLVVFFLSTHNLHKLFSQAISDLKPTQLDFESELTPILESASEIISLIGRTDQSHPPKSGVGGIAALRCSHRRLITFTIASPAVISLWLKNEPMRIGLDQLYNIFVNEMNQSLIGLLIEMIDEYKEISAKPMPTGLKCHTAHNRFFLTPKFKFGIGLNIHVERLDGTADGGELVVHNDAEVLVPRGATFSDYLGQVGLKEWLATLCTSMLECQ